ncbi:MAG: ankyrin repeat domain-containing protein [Candidatus Dependentiae bacterium]|nr:ankyrin repeat domain-containing protein [Candidatus Dependentiae bacterium]
MNYFLIISLLFSFASILSSDASTVASAQDKKITLYQRFFTKELPFELQDKIISYLEPADLVKRNKQFKEALERFHRDERFKRDLEHSCLYGPLSQNGARFIKEMLRAEYFLRKYRKEQLSQVQQEHSDLCNICNNHSESIRNEHCVLSTAVAYRNSEIAALAVACGAEIDKRYGWLSLSVLELAAKANAFRICKLLLNSGASVKIYRNCSYTPLLYAIKNDSVEGVKMFQDAGIIVASREKYEDDRGLCKLYEYSLMYTAADEGAIKVIDYLAQQGEDLNWQTRRLGCTPPFGYTPLMRAAMNGNRKIVNKLLSLGADSSLKNSSGKTYQQFLEDYDR